MRDPAQILSATLDSGRYAELRAAAVDAVAEIERLRANGAEWKECWGQCDRHRDGLLDELATAQSDRDLWRMRAEQAQAILRALLDDKSTTYAVRAARARAILA